MGYQNKDVLISTVRFPMICAGVWPRVLTKNSYLSKLMYLFSMVAKTNFFIFWISLIAETLRLIIYGYKITIIMTNATVSITVTKIAVKVIIYIKNNVFELYDEISNRERELWEENDKKIIKIYLRKVQTFKLFTRLVWILIWSAIIGLNVLGAYTMHQIITYNQAHNASTEAHIAYEFWFPGNKLEHRNWMYIINMLDSFSAMMYNITSILVLIMLLTYSASQLGILQHRLKHYIPENLQENQMDETIQVLKELIKEHQYLIRFTKAVNDKCKNIIMMEYILSSFDVALVTNIVLKMEVSEVPFWVASLGAVAFQIFILSWICNEVNLESQAVAGAAFESKWRLLNRDGQRMTLMLMQQAQQRPLVMTIGPFGPMTLQTFLTIWRVAYSYVTIIRKSGK